MFVPFTYLLGWSKLNRYYYGVRYAKDCHPIDLGVTYFSSSKYVKEFIRLNGLPDIIQVRKTFESKIKALSWEKRVIIRMKMIGNEKWLNKAFYNFTNLEYKRNTLPGSAAGAAKIRGRRYEDFMDPELVKERLEKKSKYLKANPISKKGQKKPSDNYKTGTTKQWLDPEARQRKIDGLKRAWQRRREEGRLPRRINGRFA